MQLNTKSIKSRFEKSMDKYDENAIVQQEMAKILISELIKLGNNYGSILELGSGTGLLTREVADRINFKKYTANDIVEKSKNYVSKIITNSDFICGNAQKITVKGPYDLIISNAMFQWFSNIDEILIKCRKELANDGILAFSTFGQDNFKEIRELSGVSLKYFSVDDIKNVLSKNYEIIHTEEYTRALKFKNPLELLAHMKNTGVNSLSAKPWNINEIRAFCEKYLEKYNSVKLTYNPIIVIAKAK